MTLRASVRRWNKVVASSTESFPTDLEGKELVGVSEDTPGVLVLSSTEFEGVPGSVFRSDLPVEAAVVVPVDRPEAAAG